MAMSPEDKEFYEKNKDKGFSELTEQEQDRFFEIMFGLPVDGLSRLKKDPIFAEEIAGKLRDRLKPIAETAGKELASGLEKLQDLIVNVLTNVLGKFEIKPIPKYYPKNASYRGFKLVAGTTKSSYRTKDGRVVTKRYRKYYGKKFIDGKEIRVYLGNTLNRDNVKRKIDAWIEKNTT